MGQADAGQPTTRRTGNGRSHVRKPGRGSIRPRFSLLVRQVSQCPNLVEGDGRFTSADGLHFFVIARASARETRYWIERAVERNLIADQAVRAQIDALTSATQLLNRLITYRRQRKATSIKETPTTYQSNPDPFAQTPEHPKT